MASSLEGCEIQVQIINRFNEFHIGNNNSVVYVQITAGATFLALVFAFYIFFLPFVESGILKVFLFAAYSPTVTHCLTTSAYSLSKDCFLVLVFLNIYEF